MNPLQTCKPGPPAAARPHERRFPLPRIGRIHHHATHLSIWEENQLFDEQRMVFRALLGRLRSRGFTLQQSNRYDGTWTGRKGALEVSAETGGRTSSVEFFQSVNVDNPNGGQYDSDKYERMPPTIRLQCIVELRAMAEKMVELGYTLPAGWDPSRLLRSVLDGCVPPEPPTPLDWFNAYTTDRHLKRDESGWPAPQAGDEYNNKDANGVRLRPGDVRFWRHHDGRLRVGQVYPKINNMWCCWRNGIVTFVSSHELFACAEPTPGREKKDQRGRVRRELEKELKQNNFRRVEVLARVLQRMPP